ncbi:MAG: DUF5652 family protein [Candidatus Doudnabacteria bacterium]|nr:DUF5652 family protein [Candidatus Doudnabacteria bacterium]
MITPELQKYVSDSRAAGMKDEQIRQNLTAQGWNSEDIANVLGNIKTGFGTFLLVVSLIAFGAYAVLFFLDYRWKISGQYPGAGSDIYAWLILIDLIIINLLGAVEIIYLIASKKIKKQKGLMLALILVLVLGLSSFVWHGMLYKLFLRDRESKTEIENLKRTVRLTVQKI